jgi:ribose 5-phosphate isomerase
MGTYVYAYVAHLVLIFMFNQLLIDIKLLTGVVEVGLFCDMAKAAYFGNADGSVTAKFVGGEEKTITEL